MRIVMAILTVVFITGLSSEARATSFIVDFWQDIYGETCDQLRQSATILNGCVLCHTAGGSSADLNPYALDIQAAHSGTWAAAIQAVDQNDSDGDGTVNNVEILTDCTGPGDPENLPVESKTWSGIKALYQ
jgi:hypothetical protein